MTNLFQHPNTVSGLDVENDVVVTASFDGVVRVIGPTGNVLSAQKVGSQISAVAIRNGVVATDTDQSILKEGVAITAEGQVIRGSDFSSTIRITDISRSGRYGVGIDYLCRDRLTGHAWQVIPLGVKWPLGVEEIANGNIVTVGEDGWLREWTPEGRHVSGVLIASNGVRSVETNADKTRLVVSCTERDSMQVRVIDKDGRTYATARLNSLAHDAAFLSHDRVVIGTHLGELLVWNGTDEVQSAPVSSTPVSKPGKRK